MSVPFGARRHPRMSRRQKAPSRVSSLPVRASARLKRGQQHAISFSWSQEDCGHARRGDLPCLDLSTFCSCSCWILTGVGCLMGEVKAPLGLGTCHKKSPSNIRVAWPHRLASSCRSDGRRSTAIASEHEITRRSFGSRLPRSHQGQLGWQRWERPMGKQSKVAPARAGVVGQKKGPSVFLEDFLPFALTLYLSLFPLSLSSAPFPLPAESVSCGFVLREPGLKDERPAPTGRAGTLQLQTHKHNQSLGLGLVTTHRRPPVLRRCI
jgi:hypothetical protein